MNNLDVQPYLVRAREELRAVEVNIREELYAVAISRCYYAMFYAVSGLLASIGIARSKYSGVISAFRERFIKTGLIEAEFSDILGVGFDARQESDYELVVSSQKVGANPCGCPPGQAQDLPLPQDIEKIQLVPLVNCELALKRLHGAQRFVDRVENYLKSTGM